MTRVQLVRAKPTCAALAATPGDLWSESAQARSGKACTVAPHAVVLLHAEHACAIWLCPWGLEADIQAGRSAAGSRAHSHPPVGVCV